MADVENKTMVTIEIDGRQIEAEVGKNIIEVADGAGIHIPRFCYHEELSVAANCRMCLVEVEKAPKPLPACATPVTDGMKVMTRSAYAREAQKGTMEFLLINHPLDCPICDQGGECDLQDTALGYGKDVSRYQENKRIVKDKDISPLISTDMTRCIHCTRCVRFGQEVAGIMELGMIGRGEHSRITTFVEKSVNSELSGNVIDLCPVGALTSKPFRYSARSWELSNHDVVSPHDSVGTNLNVQVLHNQVMRVLPRTNKDINNYWIADRDRYSYEAINSEERLQLPMIRVDGQWQDTDWSTALDFAARGIKAAVDKHGADQFGALAAPTSTMEEFFLTQQLARALGSNNVDHRVRQMDFSDDAAMPAFPWLGQSITDLEQNGAVLLIGSNVRKDQPMIGYRLRRAYQNGATIMAINSIDYDFDTMGVTLKVIVDQMSMLRSLAAIAKVLGGDKQASLPQGIQSWIAQSSPSDTEKAIAKALKQNKKASVLLGNASAGHCHAAGVRAMAQLISELSGTVIGYLPEGNSVAAWLAGCIPHRSSNGQAVNSSGRHVRGMMSHPLKAYLLLGVEPELDTLDSSRARTAMQVAEFVALMTAFKPAALSSNALEYADVLLPIATYAESEGTHVNLEGVMQSYAAAVRPVAEARPAWKVLRVLGNQLGLDGFDYNTIADVRAACPAEVPTPSATLSDWCYPQAPDNKSFDLIRIAEAPMYATDMLVRHAASLKKTLDNPAPAAHMSGQQAEKLGLQDNDNVTLRMTEGNVTLPLVVDGRIPDGCVYVPVGYAETSTLGAHGPATVAKT